MEHLYRSTEDQPYHLSVGGIAVRDGHLVCCQHVEEFQGCRDLYLVMRETIEMGETIESAVHRGLLEELGIEGNIVSFLGSIVSDFYRGAVRVEKTTLYFLCTIRTFDPERRPADDPDTANAVQWIDIDSLVTKSREQGERCSRSDFDEEPILRRAKEYLKDNSVGRS